MDDFSYTILKGHVTSSPHTALESLQNSVDRLSYIQVNELLDLVNSGRYPATEANLVADLLIYLSVVESVIYNPHKDIK